ncbi:MAG: AAA family ATPase [Flavobacteriales bacterium]
MTEHTQVPTPNSAGKVLRTIYIKNFILIDELHLDFTRGLTVLTGETGAGKSILLGALNAGLGKRVSSKGILKDATKKGVVEITIDIEEHLKDAFEALQLDFEPISTFRREILPSGKTRCFVNDTPTKASALQDITGHLVDINSQKDEGLIHRPLEQLSLIDSFVEFRDEKKNYEEKYIEYSRAILAIKELESIGPSEDLDYLKFVFEELNNSPVTQDQYISLEESILRAKSIRNEQVSYEKASGILNSEDGLLDQLYSLESALMQATDDQTLQDQLEQVRNIIAEIRGVERAISKGLNETISESEYNALLKEKSTIDALVKKHRVLTVEELETKRETIRERISLLENKDEELARLNELRERLLVDLDALGNDLHLLRKSASEQIERTLSKYLVRVDLPKARLELSWNQTSFGKHGKYLPELLFAANPGSNMQPLNKVASGGEQSRVKLALKAVLGRDSGLSTQLFDEIDSGISGSTAEKIGVLMKEMSVNQQIVTITHLPQVAAKGDVHLLVSKSQHVNSTTSNVVPLTMKEREQEIARMLSGENISQAAKNQAKTLLNAR